jgi:S-DNA-T family DNA segregation ATPase FtsK/SpoIIIE
VTIRLMHRPARTTRFAVDDQPRMIEAPPSMPDGKAGNPLLSLLPMVGVVSSLVMMTIIRSGAFVGLGAIVLVLAALGGLVLFMSQRGQAGRKRRHHRERYLEYLEGLRDQLSRDERETRKRDRLLNPPPEALYDVVRDPARLWERRRPDRDFLRLRIGVGEVPARRLELKQQGSAMTPTDEFMLAEANALMRRFGVVHEMPLPVPMDRVGNVSVIGPRDDALRAVRALLVQLCALHAPDDVGLAIAGPAADWAWAKWLPHVLDPARRDGVVPARRIGTGPEDLAVLLADDLTDRAVQAAEARRGLGRSDVLGVMRRLVVVHDTYGETAREPARPDEAVPLKDMGVTVVHLVSDRVLEPGDVAIRLTLVGDQVKLEDLRDRQPVSMAGRVDDVGQATAEGLVRMLAPMRLSADSIEEAPHAAHVDFPALLGIADPGRPDLATWWAPRSERAFLRVPIGIDEAGRAVLLDLKEAAQLGMGPHGLCVGATGSGKSELLRTMVLALAATHPPEQLSMMLVDYKGGATFAPFEGLPHVAGIITNLEDDAGLIERAYASLAGEVQRRQQVLKSAGNLASIGDYAVLRTEQPHLPPLPHLLVIIDEFGELLAARPDFIELFLSIGRIGRSIGVHLLLSSQRIEAGRLRGLETYLSYRLGLRTFSEEESRTVLETPDAFHLPPLPGFGYLKVDTSVYERFKGAYVSGVYRGPLVEEPDDEPPTIQPYPAYNLPVTDDGPAPEAQMPERSTAATILDVMVRGLREGAGQRGVSQIWLPPLPPVLTLDAITGPLHADARGMRLPVEAEPMNVLLGLLDDPAHQWRGLWALDLTTAGGHAAIIGGPQSGKTTLLRTLVLSLALTHTPRQVAVYAVDLTGGGLYALSGLPHVGGACGRVDRERVRRTVEEVHAMLDQREEVFRTHRVDGVEQLRALHAAGRVPELFAADVVLCVDGFGAIRGDFEEVEEMMGDLLQRGGGFGIHVIASMLRWNDVRIALQTTFGTRIELRLNDATESAVDRKLAQTVRADQPGRALTDRKLFAQVALPRADGIAEVSELGDAVESTASAVSSAWPGDPVPRVRVLPPRLAQSDLPSARREPRRVPVGVDETALEPVVLDLFGRDQHLLVFGDGECGKTNLLRLITTSLIERYTPGELVFAVFDPRRGLHDVIPEPYLGGYAGTTPTATALAEGVAKVLRERLPEDGAPTLSGFAGPRIVIVADDYDMTTTAGQQPLNPFVPFVPSGRDIGVHFVLARRVAGVSRGLYDPLVQAVRESGTTALVMSGERSEGQLFSGLYAHAQPPGRGTWVRRGERGRLIQTAVYSSEEGGRD